ncbi:squalene/phytoene synthase family protein [Streptomyces spectabilis]|uniref:Farnesyl-diphosphate farnesyltransferase n=1 Tax=Streptomyces spectabilis TaxID=68270 RepID=A0A7W8B5Y8_STRST|nr:squalene/phytoene synthase family protein [Streptomyces spectabilis]MBB5109790.1 farnesyl-diphosphate farnesyltransferase [Streptomyces spectabilis]GGV55593.1 hypothetical protein GCM10010245_88180 [Streptomyces spectabilis]
MSFIAPSFDEVLWETSRTFYLPITGLPHRLREAVAAAYLQLRAVDEIEDHPTLLARDKRALLTALADCLQTRPIDSRSVLLRSHAASLPAVTMRMEEWLFLAPEPVRARVAECTSVMARRMADWAASGWRIGDEDDLDRYTYAVAGSVGLLLADLWAWYDGTDSHRGHAVEYGRMLQAVNIRKDLHTDRHRGVTFLPTGWDVNRLDLYIQRKMRYATAYVQALPNGPARTFCLLPYELARATVDVLAAGGEKLTRAQVHAIVHRCTENRTSQL